MINNYNRFNWLIVAFFCVTFLSAQNKSEVNYFSLKDIRLLESPFKNAEDLNKKYLLELNIMII